MRRVFNIVEEPRGDVLRALIGALAPHASSVQLVLRDDLGLAAAGEAVLARLEPHLLERKRSSSWPGTTLLNGEATILRFASTDAVLDELAGAADGLYRWRQPALPEDPALLRDDGTAVLASVCHEEDAYVEASDVEYQALVRAHPEIARVVMRGTS